MHVYILYVYVMYLHVLSTRMYINMYMHPYTQVCVYKRFVLAHALQEAEKSQDLQFAEWRPGRANGTSSSPKANRHGTLERPPFHPELEGRVRPLSQLPVRQGAIASYQPSRCIQAFSRLDEAHPHQRGPSA